MPTGLLGDPLRIRQVLTNLMGAFIRHAQPGELIIDISLEPTGRAGQVRFEFSGTALRPGTFRALRDPAARQDSSNLNLSIAEQLVEAMQGRAGERDKERREHFVASQDAGATTKSLEEGDERDATRSREL